MNWNTQKYSFSFDPELDKETIRLIESVPKGKRSRMARKVFRDYLEMEKRKKCPDCVGKGKKGDLFCYYCNGSGMVKED